MKKLLSVFALLLLLSACGQLPANTTESTTQPPTTVPEPTGLYDPDSLLEQQTGGAVRVYPLEDNDHIGISLMGNRLLLHRADGTLLVVMGDLCEVVAQYSTGETIIGASGSNYDTNNQGMAYYAEKENAVILLNPQLQETSRFSMSEDMMGSPVISMDNREIYYCVPGEIRAFSMETGISRLIKTHTYENQNLENCYFNGAVILCRLTDASGKTRQLYLDTQTGLTVASDDTLYQLMTYGDNYLGYRFDSGREQIIFGNRQDAPRELIMSQSEGVLSGALAMNSAVSYQTGEKGTVLYLHDLAEAKTAAQVALDNVAEPVMITADSRYVWVLAEVDGQQALLRWTPDEKSEVENQLDTMPVYTLEKPDETGLAQCQTQVDRLNKAYAPRINIWQNAVEVTGGYTLVAEHNVKTLEDRLLRLENLLSQFPELFLGQTVDSGIIRIGLVHSIDDGKNWVQFWENGSCYILVSSGADFEDALLRGIGLAVDAHVLGHSRDYDFWDNRNPEGFSYLLSDDTSLIPEDALQYLEGESQAFIDLDSMTYPNLDRAVFFAEAMKPDNAQLFTAPYMQAKLLRICEGIREAYNVEKVQDAYPWEQYLTEEMNFSNFNRD